MGFNTFVIYASVLLTSSQVMMSTISPNTDIFFKDAIKGNLTKIVWAHAVNNKQLLNKTIHDASIMMIEADIVLGHLITNSSTDPIPIMAHPPATTSDLTLSDFLLTIIRDGNGKRGVKLDFKTIEAFNSSLSILQLHRENMTFPVWLNADILRGPVNATTIPVNAGEFLANAKKTFPESTLSLGWTTNYGQNVNITNGNYTTANIEEMINTISNTSQTITYPVRAGLAVNNMNLWTDLLNKTSDKNSTLTIWSHEGDRVDAKKLSKMIKEIGINRVYIDVPEDLMKQLHINAAPSMTPALLMTGVSLLSVFLSKLF